MTDSLGWVQSIPEDWQVVSIGQLATRVGSGITPPGGSEVYTDSGVTFIRSQNVTNLGLRLQDVAHIDADTHQRMLASAVFPCDVLLNITGASIGRSCVVPSVFGKANVNQHVCVIRLPVPDMHDAKILSALLVSHIGQRQINRLNAGANREGLNYQQLRSFQIPWPPKDDRTSIAIILSAIDETIELTEALIAKYEYIKVGLMDDLFTRGVMPDGTLRPSRAEAPHLYQDSPVGWIPAEWTTFTVGEMFDRRVERGRPGLPVMAITMAGGLVERGSVDRRVETRLGPEGHLLVREGDLAYNMMRMWQGVLGRATYDCLVSPAYVVLQPGQRINSAFAEYLFSTREAIAAFKRRSYGVVDDRLRLYFRDLVRIQFAIPFAKEEQVMIAERLAQTDEMIRRTEAVVVKLRRQKEGLMHDLVTGRVRADLQEVPT